MSITRPGLASMSPAVRPIVGALLLAFGAAGAQAQSLTEVVQAARSVDATYLGARMACSRCFSASGISSDRISPCSASAVTVLPRVTSLSCS